MTVGQRRGQRRLRRGRRGRRRGRRAPIRWNGLLAIAGLSLVIAGGYLQLVGRPSTAVQDPPIADSPLIAAPPLIAATPLVVGPSAVAVGPGKPAPRASAVPTAPSKKATPVARPGVPSLVAIERLGVRAPVVAIRAEEGALTPPGNPRTVGWWSAGALPGARRGSAVITGHTVHDGGGAFDNLEHLRIGDAVVLRTSQGLMTYRVTGVTTYRKQALARSAAAVFDQSGPGRLVLITCEDWTGKVYLSNVVVVAQPMA